MNTTLINKAFFSPGDTCKKALLTLMQESVTRLDICVFTIADNDLSQAIIDAHLRGVNVRVITDNKKSHDKGSDILQLCKKGVPVVFDKSKAHMHHKFMLVDDVYLVNGSFNWTRSASAYNQENIVVLDHVAMVDAFRQEFDRLWEFFS